MSDVLCIYYSFSGNTRRAMKEIADAVGAEIKERGYSMRNIPTNSVWFGITYESDTPFARETLAQNTAQGVYPSPL